MGRVKKCRKKEDEKKFQEFPLSLSHQKGGKGQTHMSKNWGTIGKLENWDVI
jgi:hypothetical protein